MKLKDERRFVLAAPQLHLQKKHDASSVFDCFMVIHTQ